MRMEPLPEFYGRTEMFTDEVFVKEDSLFWADYDSEKTGQVS